MGEGDGSCGLRPERVMHFGPFWGSTEVLGVIMFLLYIRSSCEGRSWSIKFVLLFVCQTCLILGSTSLEAAKGGGTQIPCSSGKGGQSSLLASNAELRTRLSTCKPQVQFFGAQATANRAGNELASFNEGAFGRGRR